MPKEGSKTVLTCESGRMVIIEECEAARGGNAPLLALAQEGKEEGYILASTLEGCPFDDCDTPGLFLSILLRPTIPVQDAGLLSAAAAVAVAKAVERLSEIRVDIRWVNDLFHAGHKMAAMVTSTRLTPEGQFDYAVLGIALCLSPAHFPPKLGEVIRRVFRDELRALPIRLAEAIAEEFFAIYDRLGSDRSFMDEYRARSMVIGKRAKILVGDTFLRGRIADIDEHAYLSVALRSGRRMTVSSRSEIVF